MSGEHKDFLCEYPFKGDVWGFTIRAASHCEAEARVRALAHAVVRGESAGSLPGWVPAWVVSLICWWRNRA